VVAGEWAKPKGIGQTINSLEDEHRSIKNILMRKISTIEKEKIKNALLIRFDSNVVKINVEEKDDIILKLNVDSCPICFAEILPNLSYILKCQHKFCKECMISYLEEEIKNSRVKYIKCPDVKCENKFEDSTIKELVNDEYFKKYLKFLQREKIKDDKTLVTCPITDCEGYTNKIQDDLNYMNL
jgi:hypothetical protein